MEAYLGSALRTPFGAFGGALRGLRLPELAARLVPHLLGDAPPPDRLLLGTALAFEPDPAARTAQLAGLPPLPCLLIQQGEASGFWALHLALETLAAGQASRVLVLAGAAPSASPFLLPDARWGTRFGEVELRDPLMDLPSLSCELEPLPAAGLIPLNDLAGGRELHQDEADSPTPAWRDGAAGFLLSQAPLPGRPRIRLALHPGPRTGEISRDSGGGFVGSAGLLPLISAFHDPGASLSFSLETPQASWTIRLTREAP